jgi:hypothetical protein
MNENENVKSDKKISNIEFLLYSVSIAFMIYIFYLAVSYS